MKKLRALSPLLITAFGLVGIGSLWVHRILVLGFGAPGAMASAAFVVYGSWLAWESRVSVREAAGTGGPDHDRGTLELAAFAKISLLLAALVPTSTPTLYLSVPGVLLMVLGAVTRGVAIRALGPYYSHRIRVPAHPLVTRGPYALVRHPAYLGTLVAHVGLTLVFPSVWSIAALALLWLPAVLVRTLLEDRELRRLPAYGEYAAEVRSSLVPFVL